MTTVDLNGDTSAPRVSLNENVSQTPIAVENSVDNPMTEETTAVNHENRGMIIENGADESCKIGAENRCFKCGADFVDNAGYQIHMLEHQLEKPFKCAVCDQAFSEPNSLTAHVKEHKMDLAKKSVNLTSPNIREEAGKKRRGRPKKVTNSSTDNSGEVTQETTSVKSGRTLRSRKSNTRLESMKPRSESLKSDKDLKSSENRNKIVEVNAMSEDSVKDIDVSVVVETDVNGEKVRADEEVGVVKGRAKGVSCESCPRTFISSYHLNMHRNVCDGSGRSTKNNRRKERAVPSTCDLCSKICISQYHLQLHRQKHSEKSRQSKSMPTNRIGCTVCKKTFKDHNALRIHMIVHSSERKYHCEVCDRQFARKHSLDLHKTIHSNDMPYSCDICGSRFRRKDSVLTHKKRKHIGSVPQSTRHYYCDICKDYFQDPSHHKTHDDSAVPKSMKVICELCGNLYASNSILREHVLTVHQRIRRFECKECGQKFLQSQALKSHMSVHSNERPYLCDTCGKSFRSKKILDRHNESHIPEKMKQMICDVCSKAFTRRSHLTRHMKIHDPNRGPPERKFACARCDRTFTSRRYLRDHETSHYRDGERPYKCDVCGLRYAHDLDLQRHLLEHDGRRDIPCQLCGKNFKSSEQYHFHLRSIHSMEPDPRVEALKKSSNTLNTETVSSNSDTTSVVSTASVSDGNQMTNISVASQIPNEVMPDLSGQINGTTTSGYGSQILMNEQSYTPMLNMDENKSSMHYVHQIIPDVTRPMFQPPPMPGVQLMGAPVAGPGVPMPDGSVRPGAPQVNGPRAGFVAPVYSSGYWVNFV